MEKIHGTSAHVGWNEGKLTFFSGGEKHERFVGLFNQEFLTKAFTDLFHPKITVYGEAYGGKMQGMSGTYGPDLKFIVFDVQVGDSWLNVPDAEDVTKKLGLEFVHYTRISTILDAIDAARDADSVQAIRNGVGAGKKMEGVVLRPLIELTTNNGSRVMSKHKRTEFMETATARKVDDPAKLQILLEAEAIANEWVTGERLKHVLDKLPLDINVESTGKVIAAMVEDVEREAAGEIKESEAARKAIGKKTAGMFRQYINQKLRTAGT